ncbi:hypothetical protein ISS06_00835 [Patescibacteria group bacterium]|nr:hypothetical protein [Patescibacteria group bacterium]
MDIEQMKKLIEQLQAYLPFYGKILSCKQDAPDSPLGRIDKLWLIKSHLKITIVQERINKKGRIYDKPPLRLKIPIDEIHDIFSFKTKDGRNIILEQE